MPDPFDVSGGGDYSDSAYGTGSSGKKRRASPESLYSPGIGITPASGFSPSPRRSSYQASASPGLRSQASSFSPGVPQRPLAEPVFPSATTPYPDMMPNLSPVGRTVGNPLVPGPTAPSLSDTSLYASPEARFPVGSVPAAPIGWENPFYPGAGVPAGRSGRGAGGR